MRSNHLATQASCRHECSTAALIPRTEACAGRVACCPLVGQFEYTAQDGTDRQTDGLTDRHHVDALPLSARRGKRKKLSSLLITENSRENYTANEAATATKTKKLCYRKDDRAMRRQK